jgi:hypothetical protein
MRWAISGDDLFKNRRRNCLDGFGAAVQIFAQETSGVRVLTVFTDLQRRAHRNQVASLLATLGA